MKRKAKDPKYTCKVCGAVCRVKGTTELLAALCYCVPCYSDRINNEVKNES